MIDEKLKERIVKIVKDWSDLPDETIIEAYLYGAQNGFPGFTYYEETTKFVKQNEFHIFLLLAEIGEQMGGGIIKALTESINPENDVYSADQFYNLLAWMTLEAAGKILYDKKEGR